MFSAHVIWYVSQAVTLGGSLKKKEKMEVFHGQPFLFIPSHPHHLTPFHFISFHLHVISCHSCVESDAQWMHVAARECERRRMVNLLRGWAGVFGPPYSDTPGEFMALVVTDVKFRHIPATPYPQTLRYGSRNCGFGFGL